MVVVGGGVTKSDVWGGGRLGVPDFMCGKGGGELRLWRPLYSEVRCIMGNVPLWTDRLT